VAQPQRGREDQRRAVGVAHFIADQALTPERLGGSVELCHSLDYIERAFQDAREGRPAERPFSDSVIPSTLDRTLSPEGTHIMSMFTQWVPHTWAGEPHQAELAAYADRVVDLYAELAPNFKRSILHRQVIGPYEMETRLRARRREHLPWRAVPGSALPSAARTRLRRFRHAAPRPLPMLVGDARRWWCDRHCRVLGKSAHPCRSPPGSRRAPAVSNRRWHIYE
jgi:phytoene dehydrogenase-like protein